MQDLQVETFGSMERREKIDFILEQMRLLRLLKDWEKLAIVSKKINAKWLAEDANEDLKLRFYALMISYALHTSKYLELCKFYRSVYESPSVQSDQAKWTAALRNVVFFVVLAPYDNEQHDLLNRVAKDEKLQKIEGLKYVYVLRRFTGQALIVRRDRTAGRSSSASQLQSSCAGLACKNSTAPVCARQKYSAHRELWA